MLAYDHHEEQLVQELVTFWKRYKYVLTTLCMAVLSLAAFYAYKGYRVEQQAATAAEYYQSFLDSLEEDDLVSSHRIVQVLQKKYPSTPYASMAVMNVVQQLIKNNQLDEAQEALTWLTHHTQIPIFNDFAYYKKAQLLYAAHNFVGSLTALGEIENDALAPLIMHLKAKNLAQLGSLDHSVELYKTLLSDSTLDKAQRALLTAEYNYLLLSSEDHRS